MVFSSINFIFYFLVIVIALYALVKGAYKNGVLLLSSLFFYFYGEGTLVIILVGTLLFSYYYARFIEKHRKPIYLFIGMVISFLPLIYFKYTSFILSNFGIIYHITLPLGISFFSFQAASYIIDVYRDDVKASHSLVNYGTYLTFFGQLVAGPIVRYETIAKEVERIRPYNEDETYIGIRRFMVGLFKKCVLANMLGLIVSEMSAYDSGLILWMIAISEVLQLYFDFSAYSDMAIGLGLFFGFHFLENFDYPLMATSVRTFWQRWHISLGTWFKDYVYFPLGGSRVKPLRHIFNLLVVWLLTGLWHGAAWNFVLWGLYFGVLIILERYTPLRNLTKIKYVDHIYTLFVVIIGFAFFNHPDTLGYLAKMFDISSFIDPVSIYYLSSYGLFILIAFIGATPLIKRIYRKVICFKYFKYIEVIGIFALFFMSLAYLVGLGFNPFLYFRF